MRLLWLALRLWLGESLRRTARAPPAEGTSDAAAAAAGTAVGDLGSRISEIGEALVASAERADMGKEFVGKRRARDASTVDFCMVVTNDGPIQEFGIFLHSINKHRGSMAPKFNIVTNAESLTGIKAALQKEELYDAEFVMLQEDRIKQKLDELRLENGFHGGMPAVAKAFMWEFWPEVERCVTLDTDTYLVAPLEELAAPFDSITGKQVMAAVWRPQLDFGDKINTGVLLHDFASMRRNGWSAAVKDSSKMIMTAGTKETTSDGRPVLTWADQELVHGALMAYCDEVATELPGCGMQYLDRRWNNEMARAFYESCNGGYQLQPGLLHFNSGNPDEQPYWCRKEFKEDQYCIQGYMWESLKLIYPDCPPEGFNATEAP